LSHRLFYFFPHLNKVIHKFACMVALASAPVVGYSMGTVPRGCTGSAPLGSFRISVRRSPDAPALPLKSLALVPAGARLIWDPVHLSPQVSGKAEVAALLVPQSRGSIVVLDPRKAAAHAEWDIPQSPAVVALILGPHGLSMGKVKSLMSHNEDLLMQLADYAEQTSEVETLVQQLADSEDSGKSADAALKGFSSQFGIAMPKLDTKAATDQQASVLLRAVLPSANSYDPLAPAGAQMQQSVGLAAAVAGLFFGNNVALAAGGAALFGNLKTVMFPNTEFRSAFAQTNAGDALALCTKSAAAKSRTRLAYLWAYRVPAVKPPVVAITGPAHLPLGLKSAVPLRAAEGSEVKELSRAHDWRLLPLEGGAPVAVPVTVAANAVELDLSKSKAAAGAYRLAAGWDWDPLSLGTVWLEPCDSFAGVKLAPGMSDKLIEGSGTVSVQLTGGDFQFVERVQWKKKDAPFVLPAGKRNGEQRSIRVDLDTAVRGQFSLTLIQSDGKIHEIPVTVLPPSPRISNLPVRVNQGEARQRIRLAGSGLEEIVTVTSPAGPISGGAAKQEWSGEIELREEGKIGRRFPITLQMKGRQEPIMVPDAIEVVGPRPEVASIRKSMPAGLGVALREDELPAGITLGWVLQVLNLHGRPRVDLGCEGGSLRHALQLATDEPSGGASLSFAGPGELYLSLDPATVGYPGCTIVAAVTTDPEGRSNPTRLGRIVRIPRVDQFTLTNEAVGPDVFAGILKGSELDLIEKAGWDAQHGLPVDAIPAPLATEPNKQTLRISLPWPAPAPHAPLYVWLRGEAEGRKTSVSY
jgi:hypothetical protein